MPDAAGVVLWMTADDDDGGGKKRKGNHSVR